jgi:hypothetical protein
MTIKIVLRPAVDRRGRRKPGCCFVYYDGAHICTSTQPLLDASRILIARGLDPATPIEMTRDIQPTLVLLSSTIGRAAQYDVMGDKFVRRKSLIVKNEVPA